MTSPKEPESRIGDDMHVDLAGRMTYGDYLQLDTLLAAKKPLSDKHDEHLFIIIHHVHELWLNLMAHELESAIANIERDQLPPAFKSMARMTRILEQMIRAWDVLSTMTPSDYLEFRSVARAVLRLPVLPVPAGRIPPRGQGRRRCCCRTGTMRKYMRGWRPPSRRPASMMSR